MSPLSTLWTKVSESLWFVPGLFAVGSLALAFGSVEVDRRLLDDLNLPAWLFLSGAEGARGVLSAIAGGLITVTGVVFSVTIVALQLASSQFTPRVLRNFTSDRGNQVVLGVFIGTFTYSLLVLRAVRSSMEQQDAFVPSFSVTIAVVLTLVSVGFLIYFIDHVARAIQVEHILRHVAAQTIHIIEHLRPRTEEEHTPAAAVELPSGEGVAIEAGGSGYLQAFDHPEVLELARERDLLLRVEVEPGDFVLKGAPLARVWPAERAQDDEVREKIRDAFVLGTERTPHQDIGRGILELVDIAVKALSPGINDPTTAIAAVHRLSEVLLVLDGRDGVGQVRTDEDGKVRLVLRGVTFASAVEEAFEPIAIHAAEDPRVLRNMLRQLSRLGRLLPPERHDPLSAQADAILVRARERLESSRDLATVEEEASRAPWREPRKE